MLALATAPAPVHAQIVTCESGDWEDFTACVQAGISVSPLPYHCETWRTVSPANPGAPHYRALCSGEPPSGLEPVLEAFGCEEVSPPNGEPDWDLFWYCIDFFINHWQDGGRTCRVFTVDLGEGVKTARGVCRHVH